MVEDLTNRGYYVTIHDAGSDDGSLHGGGMSAGWIPGEDEPGGDRPGRIDDMIREFMGGSPPPPPPPPEWTTVYEDVDTKLQKKLGAAP
jgi:hypothetical protein